MKFKYYWSFREQDGDWSQWYPCTWDEYLMRDGRPDTRTKAEPAPPTSEGD